MQLFKFLKWPILGGIGFLLLSVMIYTGIYFFTSAPPKDDCEVYQALTAEIQDEELGYMEVFKPYIAPLNDTDLKDRFSWVRVVTRRTNQKTTVPAGDENDSYEAFVTEDVAVDISSINWTPSSKERKSLAKCYTRESRPIISSLNLEALALREGIMHGPSDAWPTIWQLSGVAKSEDGSQAIVFVNSYCGGLCGWGGFYLLEKTDSGWKVIGSHTEWVS